MSRLLPVKKLLRPKGRAFLGRAGNSPFVIGASYPTLAAAYAAGYGQIGFIGDSLFSGWGAGTTSANSKNSNGAYALATPAAVIAAMGGNAMDGCIPPDNAINLGIGGATSTAVTAAYDPRRSFGTGWAINGASTAAGGYMSQGNAAGTGLSLTPTEAFDTIDIIWMDQVTGAASATVKVDGVTVGTLTPSNVNSMHKTTLSCTLGTHTITIDRVGAVDSVFPAFVRTKNSTKKQLSITNLGMVGAKVSDWLVSTNVWSPLNTIPLIAAHLWIIQLGANDINGAVPFGTFKTNLQSLITACKSAGGDVQLVVPTPANGSFNVSTAYINAIYDLSSSNSLPTPIDLNALFGSYTASSSYYFDAVHLLSTGYSRCAAEIKTRIVGGSNSVTRFSPSTLSPALWVEAGKGGAFQSNAGTTAAVANGDVVGYLPDLSGNAKHQLSVADDTTRPTLQGAGASPYISFDGSNDLLTSAQLGSYAAGSASWFFAINSASAVNFATLASESSTAAAAQFYDLLQRGSSGTNSGVGVTNDAGTSTGSSTAFQNGVFTGGDKVYGVVDTGTQLIPYLDGVAGTPLVYSRSGSLTLNNFALGALRRSTVILFCVARIYSGVCVNRVLTSGEIASLTTYLGATQGRTL